MTQTILLKRTGALGDLLEVTPIIRRLRMADPDSLIDVDCKIPEVFRGNPHLDSAHASRPQYDRTFDLNGAFERRLRRLHPIDAYSEEVFGDRLTPHTLDFQLEHPSRSLLQLLGPRFAVLHAARSWPIRTLPREFWQTLIRELEARHLMVALTGTLQDWDDLKGAVDFRAKMTLAQQAGLINAANVFICSESGPMILAQTTRVPVIPLLTMVPPSHVAHERFGTQNWRWHPLQSPIGCVGCAAEQPAETIYFDCYLGHRQCVTLFDPIAVASLAAEVQVGRAN